MPYIPGVGILVSQAPLTTTGLADQLAEIAERRADAITEAQEHLAETGMSPWSIVELDMPSRTRRAWYSNEFGFVYPEHPDAVLVLVVEIPMPDEPPSPDPVEVIEG